MKRGSVLILAIVIPLVVVVAVCAIYVTSKNRRQAEANARRYDEAVALAGRGEYAQAMQVLEDLMMPSCGADLSAKAKKMYAELQQMREEEKREASKAEEHNESLRRLELETQKKEAWEKDLSARAEALQKERENWRAKFDSLPYCSLCGGRGYKSAYSKEVVRDKSGKEIPSYDVCEACSCERGRMLSAQIGEHFRCPRWGSGPLRPW
jgi:hypothetical protein